MFKSGYLFLLLAAISLGASGCGKTQDLAAGQFAQSQAPDPGADGNLAPVSAASAPAPPQYQEDGTDGEQPLYASQPPPPLPAYDQPPAPGDNYMWTPGSWSYGAGGYYWVPGAWVLAPYVDALWTPPYWDYYGGRYRWHRGYWGRHIGFYGGIDYGFGYTGQGYYGGYWNGGSFAYNRAVTNVNVTIVHNVYERRVAGNTVRNRVSYNGGPGGIGARPIPAELAALRETRTPPVAAQLDHARAAGANRSQFASTSQGRPAVVAQAQPLAASYRTQAAHPAAAEQPRPAVQYEPGRSPFRQAPQPVQPQPAQNARVQAVPYQRTQNEPPRQQVVPGQPQNQRFEANRPVPQPVPQPIPQARPNAPEQRQATPAPQPAPERSQRERPAPQQQLQQQLQQQPRPEPAARPVPAGRLAAAPPAAAPAAPPAARPAARPAPDQRQAPQPGRHEEKDRR